MKVPDKIKQMFYRTRDQVRDVAERAAWTAVQTFGAVFLPTVLAAASGKVDVETIQAAAISAGIAALSAGFSVVKGWIATEYGDGSASTVNLGGVTVDLSTLFQTDVPIEDLPDVGGNPNGTPLPADEV